MARLSLLFLAAAALVCVAPAAAIDVVPNLNVTAYLGRWFQMYTDLSAVYEGDDYCTNANYHLRDDGKISVFNTERQGGYNGKVSNITGYAYAPDPKVPAKLKVHFSVAPVDAPYWVVAIGPKTTTNDPECSPCYDWAVVSDGLKISLFVLARDPVQYIKEYNSTVFEYLEKEGFNSFINRPIGDRCNYSQK